MKLRAFFNNPVVRFVLAFVFLFAVFYYFNIFFFGITSPGNHYSPFFARHLNYIAVLRQLLLDCSKLILGWLGYTAIDNNYQLLVAGRGTLVLSYGCLGLGLMSFFSAFVLAYPAKIKSKIIFLILGLFTIQFLNVMRFVLLAVFWSKKSEQIVDHHTLFNIILYIIIALSLYIWVKRNDKLNSADA